MQAPGQVEGGSGEGSEGSGEGLEGFGAEPGQVQQGSGEGFEEGLEALVQSQVRFNRVPEKVPEKSWEACSTGFRRRFREGLGSFGAEPGQVQQGSGEGSGEGRGGLVQSQLSQVKFNRVPKKVPGKVWEALVQSRSS